MAPGRRAPLHRAGGTQAMAALGHHHGVDHERHRVRADHTDARVGETADHRRNGVRFRKRVGGFHDEDVGVPGRADELIDRDGFPASLGLDHHGDALVALSGALRETLNTREMRDKFEQQAFVPFVTTPEEAGKFIADGNTRPGGKLPLNTNGGGLSYMHSGMYGMYALQESVRQMRGIAPAQVKDAKISVCHGVGGMFAASGTIIFTNER